MLKFIKFFIALPKCIGLVLILSIVIERVYKNLHESLMSLVRQINPSEVTLLKLKLSSKMFRFDIVSKMKIPLQFQSILRLFEGKKRLKCSRPGKFLVIDFISQMKLSFVIWLLNNKKKYFQKLRESLLKSTFFSSASAIDFRCLSSTQQISISI